MPRQPTILFSTFEPSGDALAAGVIARMRRCRPDLRVLAFGGPRMAEVGAELIESTTHHASMALETVKQAWSHRRRLQRLHEQLRADPIDLLVPVDSPAANWSICSAVRADCRDAGIVHLVAPQLWAWGPWRIKRLRRCTDHVLCILPFEPQWFATRGVRADYVGHPVFDPDCHAPGDDKQAGVLPEGDLRLALLPGSRTGEITRNLGTMLEVFRQLRQRHEGLQAVVAALDERIANLIREVAGQCGGGDLWGRGLHLVTGQTPSVLRWSRVVLATSGTVTLQVAAAGKPMVAMYNASWWAWQMLGRFLALSRTLTLPNLISEWLGQGRAIEEFVPHFRDPRPLAASLSKLISDEAHYCSRQQALRQVVAAFGDQVFAQAAATKLLEHLDRVRAVASDPDGGALRND